MLCPLRQHSRPSIAAQYKDCLGISCDWNIALYEMCLLCPSNVSFYSVIALRLFISLISFRICTCFQVTLYFRSAFGLPSSDRRDTQALLPRQDNGPWEGAHPLPCEGESDHSDRRTPPPSSLWAHPNPELSAPKPVVFRNPCVKIWPNWGQCFVKFSLLKLSSKTRDVLLKLGFYFSGCEVWS
jgi:hypothetical protein